MALPSDGNSKSKFPTGNRFLVVPPLTKEAAARKAEKDKQAAKKRAPIVNAKLTVQQADRQFRAKQAREQFMTASAKRDSDIVRSVSSFSDTISPFNKQEGTGPLPGSSYSFQLKYGRNELQRGLMMQFQSQSPVENFLTGSFDDSAYRSAGAGQYGGTPQLARNTNVPYVTRRALEAANGSEVGARARVRAEGDNLGRAYLSEAAMDDVTHAAWISLGELWKDDLVTLGVYESLDPDNPDMPYEDLMDLATKIENYQKYYGRWTAPKSIFDLQTGKYVNRRVLRKDAPLPPWIPHTTQNLQIWDYYINYMDATFDLQKNAAEEAKRERDYAEANNFKSAMSEEDGEGVINSLIDAIAADWGDGSGEHIRQYWREYLLNPVKSGKFKTLAGNVLFGLGDTMDAFARGERAVVAAGPVLGGTYEAGHSMLEGQNEFWVSISGYSTSQIQEAQRLFVQSGGLELLKGSDEYSKYGANMMSNSERSAYIAKQFKDNGISIPWQMVRNAIRDQYLSRSASDLFAEFRSKASENIAKTYTTAGADFNANTGSVINDIVAETVFDPGLLLGSAAKSLVKGGVREATSRAVLRGFRNAFGDVDLSGLLNNKAVRQAVRHLEKVDGGSNIIFRRADSLKADVEILTRTLDEADIFTSGIQRDAFQRTVLAELVEKTNDLNSNVLEHSPKFLSNLNDKVVKTAYFVDHGIDKIDTILLKSSIPAPFILADTVKLGTKGLAHTPVGKYFANKAIKRGEIVQSLVKNDGQGIRVATENLMNNVAAVKLTDRDIAKGVRIIKSNFDEVSEAIDRSVRNICKGKADIQNAIQEVDEYIKALTNGDYSSVDELEEWIETLDPIYRNEYRLGLDNIKRAKSKFDEYIDLFNSKANEKFLEELDEVVSNAPSVHDAKRACREVFEKYGGIVDHAFLRDEIVKIIQDVDFTDELILGTSEAIKNGTVFTKDTVIKSITKINPVNTDIVHRTMPASDFAAFSNRVLSMPNPQLAWTLNDVKALGKRKGDLNYTDIYDAIDNACYKVTFMYNRYKQSDLNGVLDTYNELLKLQDLIRHTDTIATNSASSISTFHLDIHTALNSMLQDSSVRYLLDEYYDAVYSKVLKKLDTLDFSDIPADEQGLVYTLANIQRHREAIRLYEDLDSKLSMIPGMTETKLYAIESAILGHYSGGRDILDELTRRPDAFWDYINEVVYNNYGGSKLSMGVLSNQMRSLLTSKPDEFFAGSRFIDELQDPEKKAVRDWFSDIVSRDLSDPQAYADMQVLSVLLMNPDEVARLNKAAANGDTKIFFHCSSTGFSSEADTITGIGYRKWIPIEDPENITLTEIRKIFLENKPVELKVKMTEEEISRVSHDTLKAIFSSEDDAVALKDRFFRLFGGAASSEDVVTEGDILERFFNLLYEDQVAGQGKRKVIKPYSFVVHDLQSMSGANGFNMRLLNNRVRAYAEDATKPFTSQYSNGLALRSANQTDNTLKSFRNIIPDNAFTEDEFYQVEKLVRDYAIERANKNASGVKMLDFESYLDLCMDAHRQISNHKITDSTSDFVKALVANDIANRFDASGVLSAINRVEAAESVAKSFVAKTTAPNKGRVGSMKFADADGFARYIDDETFNAFNDIASIFGIDLTFQNDIGALGHHYGGHGNTITGTAEVMLNPYFQDSMADTFMHELRHTWSKNGDFGKGFKDTLRLFVINEVGSIDQVNVINSRAYTPHTAPALEQYISFIAPRYRDLVPLSDSWMEEFVAPIFEFYFSNIEGMQKLRTKMLALGFEATDEGIQALDFLDKFSVIIRNSDSLKQWDKLLEEVDFSHSKALLNDCLYQLTSDDALLTECANSILNMISHKDELQANLLQAVSTSNPVRGARFGNGPNIVNTDVHDSIDNIRRYFSLGDTLSSRQDLVARGVIEPDVDEDLYFVVQHSISTLNKMNDVAEYISRIRATDITSNASEVLAPFDTDIREFLTYAIHFVSDHSDTIGATTFDWVQYVNISSSTLDNFLIAQKVYDDMLKWAFSKDINNYTEFMEALKHDFLNSTTSTFYKNAGVSTSVLDILDGSLDLQIYKSGRITDQYARRFHYTMNSMENDLVRARAYRNAYHEISSTLAQKEHASLRLRLNGIRTAEDSLVGRAYQSVLTAVEKFGSRVEEPLFQATTKELSLRHYDVLQQYRLDRLKVDGTFNEDKLISELLWNGHNHIVFQPARYTEQEMLDLIDFVEGLSKKGIDYISCDVDDVTGKLYIYLNNKVKVYGDTSTNIEKRYIHHVSDNKHGSYYARPEFENLHDATILQRKNPLQPGLGDFSGYDELMDAWQSIDILSGGLSRGTSGRVLSEREIEHYYNTLPAFMKDMCPPLNMIESGGLDARLVYDPGFIIEGETDYFLDMLDTMRYQKKVMNNGTATLAYMFGNGAPTKFGHIMQGIPDEAIMEFFTKESDFVVCTVVPDSNFVHGVRIRQLKMDNVAAIDFARNTDNAVILPYDTYLTVLGDINISTNPSSVRASFNKALVVLKAFQLCNIGSWVRNWYDATKKAAMDMGETPSNTWKLLMYQGKAMKDFGTFRKIIKYYDGYVDGSSWEIIRKTFDTDMTYEDFVVLSNMFHSSSMTRDAKYFGRNTNRLLSGEEGGIRGLSEKDITNAFDEVFNKEANTPIDKKRFIAIHQKRIIPSQDEQLLFDDMLRQIDTKLRSTRLVVGPQKALNILFHPFSLSENIVRYAQTQYLRDFGMTDGQISQRIHLTQFESRRNLTGAQYLEYAVPYANYIFDNCKYWMRMIEQNPRYFKYFTDAYGNVVSDHIEDMLDKGQEFDMERDNMVLTGGIPLGGTGMYFKLNPSFLDFLQTFYGGATNIVDHLNPLLNVALRGTLADLGYGAKYFFEEWDLEMTPENFAYKVASMIPLVNKVYTYMRSYAHVDDFFGDEAGVPAKLFFTLAASLIGLNVTYGDSSKGTFEEWQKELAKDGKWFDCNKFEIVSLDEYNETGANNPENTWEDTQAYMLMHFHKVWDGNQGAWVDYWNYTYGGFNERFDFEKDPTAWDRLCELYLKEKNMVYDYNIGEFVLRSELSDGDLNDPDITWSKRKELYYQKFGKVWDENRRHFVNEEDVIPGGLNDPNLNGRQKAALRLAMFGKAWDDKSKSYIDVQEPTVVLLDDLFKDDDSESIYKLLGIPRLANLTSQVHVNSDGILVDSQGRYVLTRDPEYNQKIFDKITAPYAYNRRFFSRNYAGYKRRSWIQFTKAVKKPKRVWPSYNPFDYYPELGWDEREGKYEWQYLVSYRFRFRVNGPSMKLFKSLAPHVHYPYGGVYKKFSFHTR